MTVYEVMSIVAISLTALTSVSAIVIPLIINRKNTKEQRLQSERNQQKEMIQSTINEFMTAFANWECNAMKAAPLLNSIYKTMLICREDLKNKLFDISKLFFLNTDSSEIDIKIKEALNLLVLDFHIKPNLNASRRR